MSADMSMSLSLLSKMQQMNHKVETDLRAQRGGIFGKIHNFLESKPAKNTASSFNGFWTTAPIENVSNDIMFMICGYLNPFQIACLALTCPELYFACKRYHPKPFLLTKNDLHIGNRCATLHTDGLCYQRAYFCSNYQVDMYYSLARGEPNFGKPQKKTVRYLHEIVMERMNLKADYRVSHIPQFGSDRSLTKLLKCSVYGSLPKEHIALKEMEYYSGKELILWDRYKYHAKRPDIFPNPANMGDSWDNVMEAKMESKEIYEAVRMYFKEYESHPDNRTSYYGKRWFSTSLHSHSPYACLRFM